MAEQYRRVVVALALGVALLLAPPTSTPRGATGRRGVDFFFYVSMLGSLNGVRDLACRFGYFRVRNLSVSRHALFG